jgi:hypothetical protein
MVKKDLGNEFWALVKPYTGEISAVRHAERGYSSDITAVVDCTAGPVFLKAVRESSQHASSLMREAQINPYVRSVSPALRWQLRESGWIILAFDVITGTYSDFASGSPDLPAVADAVNMIGAIDCPDIAHNWQETRWDWFTDDEHLFAGEALLYTDINPDNFLITTSGISVVDWSWPTRGAAFIDPACLAVQLVAAGHTAAEAESWAERCTAWRTADTETINAFVIATIRMYRHFESRDPAPWRKEMTGAVTAWGDYRNIPEAEYRLSHD